MLTGHDRHSKSSHMSHKILIFWFPIIDFGFLILAIHVSHLAGLAVIGRGIIGWTIDQPSVSSLVSRRLTIVPRPSTTEEDLSGKVRAGHLRQRSTCTLAVLNARTVALACGCQCPMISCLIIIHHLSLAK